MRRLFRTPRTALTWATLDEWLGCAWRIERRRPQRLAEPAGHASCPRAAPRH
jgi:hypothetical protein